MHFRIRSVFGVISSGVFLAAVIIAAAAWFTARHLDQGARETQTKIARLGISDIYSDLQGRLVASAYRDSTYRNVVQHWNILWIEREMTNYLPSLGIHRVVIFDTNGYPVYIGRNWQRLQNRTQLLQNADGMHSLLDFRYIRRTSPHVNQGVVVVGGKPYFAVSARILPTVELPDPTLKDYTLVFFKPAREQQFYALSLGFRAEDVDISLTPSQVSGLISFPLVDAADVPRAYLIWEPQRPGTLFLWVVLPVLFFILGLLTWLLLHFVSRWQNAQSKLMKTEAQDRAMQEEIRVKAIFIGNISHELRTPLNAILGFAEMLDMQVFGKLGSTRYEEYVGHIISSGRELLRMVNDLIEIARIRSKDTAKEREPIDAAAILLKVLDGGRSLAERKKVLLDLGECSANAWCLGSELSLSTALTKMVENAISVTPAGKTVSAEIVRQDQRLQILVSDQGLPIPEETLELVNGDLYVFSGDHLVSHKNGAGLNFEIAKGLAKLMSGSLLLESRGNAGNRAVLDLPVSDMPQVTGVFRPPAPPPRPPDGKADGAGSLLMM